jgi:hypothetical protein
MSRQLDRAELLKRFKSQGSELLIQVASLLQGGILSAAAFSLIEILRSPSDTVLRLILWLMSVVLSLVIFSRICSRAPFVTHAGIDVLFMVPIMGLFEIILFAVLASSALGQGGWRYWYVVATLFAAASFLATWLNLHALKRGQYGDDAEAAFLGYKALLRRSCVETMVVAVVTGALTVWLLSVPSDWPYAIVVVSVHVALAIVASFVGTRREARDSDALSRKLAG